jgi:Spy/CpxP family protein refolding chaperone
MLTKLVIRVVVALVVLAMLTPAVSAAGAPSTPRPAPGPTPQSQSQLQALVVQSARALRESLTDSQRKALAGVMQRREAELRAANKSLAHMQSMGRAGRQAAPSAAEASSLATAVEAATPVLAKVQAEFLAVMTPSQQAQFKQTLSARPAARATSLAVAADADPCTPNGIFHAFYATNYSRNAFYYANLNFLTYGTPDSFNGFVWALADMTLANMASDNIAAGNCSTAKDQFLSAGNAGVNAFNFESADFAATGQVLAFFAMVYSFNMFTEAFLANESL